MLSAAFLRKERLIPMKTLFIDIDTLRADHMGCYGYSRNTTPNMDQVAKGGVMFTNYYCSDAPCLPSRAALSSGMFGIHNGAVGHGSTAGDMMLFGLGRGFTDERMDNSFFSVFQRSGIHTASISTFPERHAAWWFNAGLNEIHNVGKRGGESAEEVIPIALDWVEKNAEREDWFLHLHLWDPHTPYRAPAEFGNPFEDEPLENWITEEIFEDHLTLAGPHGLNEIGMYTDVISDKYPRQPGKVMQYSKLKDLFDGYDCGIRYADQMIGKVFDALKAKGVYEEVTIIITSDHGENMGELGIYSEHGTADQPTCNIPMIISMPKGAKNVVDNELHYNLDIVPTMAELLQAPRYEKWDGQSYLKTLLTGEPQGREDLVISQMAHVCQRSARFGDWLYIRTYHDGFHLLFDDEMLFNLKEDPHETVDVKGQYPEVCAKGTKIILDWHDQMMKTSLTNVDPLWTVIREGGPYHARLSNLKPYIKRLEMTGRGDKAEILRKKYNIN